MISPDEILFRCSGLVHIMSEAGAITAKQLQTIREYEARPKEGKGAMTDNMKKEYADLIAKRDNKELPDGVKTHLIDLYTSIYEGRSEHFSSKAIEKGNVHEPKSIALLGLYLKRRLKKNEVRKSDDLITGEIDCEFTDEIGKVTADTKTSYSRLTFNRIRFKEEINSEYEEQGRGYMRLWGSYRHIVAHCCVNGLAKHIEHEINMLQYQYEKGSTAWFDKARQIEINHIFNLGEFLAENENYELLNNPADWSFDIPWQKRIYTWEIQRDLNWERKLEKRIPECRAYIKSLLTV